MFARLSRTSRKAFVTYTVACDPDFDASLARMHAFVASGIDMIEIGHPFSDPILDGLAIQAANRRALAAGGNLERTFALCAAFRETDSETPLVLMGYANPIAAMGYQSFAAGAAEAGIDALIAGDFPLREAKPLLDALAEHGLKMILMAAPTLDEADFTSDHPAVGGFLYCIPVVGPTGGPSASTEAIADSVERCRAASPLPVMVGFGIKTPDKAAAVGQIADGVIVASAMIESFAAYLENGKEGFLDFVGNEVQAYRQAIDNGLRIGSRRYKASHRD
ncbi:tryptophan synthase subunit alpha [Roseicyclus sp. F158]|uniref:Tryptophan synthase alpha chain n=1 Tax=Tropicimonas omnivorans TaxID=3075590 RepID=A0ABU3DGW6_9RHOB|nr:tryptophan synthase subunit alpha [Roseicyclus sp. F158]MDT0682407.1 tryptophan synthase subunit alpha [Roseicyclus sp. F158]